MDQRRMVVHTPETERAPAWELWLHSLALAAALVLIFVVATSTNPAVDFWWQLRTGERIVRTGAIPYTDLFSWTAHGDPWLVQEWLTEVLFFLLWEHTPHWSFVLYKAGLATLACGLVMKRCEGRGVGFWLILGAGLLTAWGIRPFSDLRPQMITFAFAALLLWRLDAYRERGGPLPWLLPPWFLIWANLHAGVIVGFLLLGAWIAGDLAERWYRRQNYAGVRLLLLGGAAAAVAAMVNPNGYHLYTYPLKVLGHPQVMGFIREWLSPNFHLWWYRPFEAALLGSVVVVGLLRRPRWCDLALLLMLGHMALFSARNTPLFVVAAAPAVAEGAAALVAGLAQRVRWADLHASVRAAAHAVFGSGVIVLVGVLIWVGTPPRPPAEWFDWIVDTAYFPVEGARRLKQGEWPGRLYNDYSWGGYLIWHAYPERPVFIDGRAEVYYESNTFDDEYKLFHIRQGWKQALDERGVEVVLTRSNGYLGVALSYQDEWERVFDGQVETIFVRRTPLAPRDE